MLDVASSAAVLHRVDMTPTVARGNAELIPVPPIRSSGLTGSIVGSKVVQVASAAKSFITVRRKTRVLVRSCSQCLMLENSTACFLMVNDFFH
ncbi:MAG TPA: hypothetical protein PKE40_08330, partial [Arachnia sp.]|nr:hypothetical protein [Arachnia sp.]HMT86343.1 hypothetical protein [Arachnia sp.]